LTPVLLKEQIEHTVEQLIAQRIYALALGYEDLDYRVELHNEPLLAAVSWYYPR